jgi:flagellin-like hook-associated protein FlgL
MFVPPSRLAAARDAVARADERLATGVRINRGSDDPAGVIAAGALAARAAALDSRIAAMEREGVDDAERRALETERINTVRALSTVRDTDYAKETAERARAGVMEQANLRVLVIGRRAAADAAGALLGVRIDLNG